MNFTFDLDIISDLHKDARGYRPTQDFWTLLAVSNSEQKQIIWDDLLVELRVTMAEEAARENEAVADFENKIKEKLAEGVTDRVTAIKLIIDPDLQDYDLLYGGEYVCFKFDLPYSWKHELDPIVAQIGQERAVEQCFN
jgi:hypothetical protein